MTLADYTDVEFRMGRHLETTEIDRMVTLLADASAAIVSYCGQDFERVERTATWVYPDACGNITLTGKDPADPEFTDTDDNVVSATQVGRKVWRIDSVGPVTQVWTSGWDEVPAAIVGVCCQIAARAFGSTPEASGITSETTGPFTIQLGSAGASGSFGLLAGEQAVLDRYRKPGVGTYTLTPWAS